MDNILAQRYEFCDSSSISGFPNPVPDREVWEYFLLRFGGKIYDHPGEHLLYFHKCMLKLKVIHEDVLIKMFRYSLEGVTCDWCRSLLPSSIFSLKQIHVAFHHYCKESFPIDFLYKKCCYEFDLLSKRSDSDIKYHHVEENDAIDNTFLC